MGRGSSGKKKKSSPSTLSSSQKKPHAKEVDPVDALFSRVGGGNPFKPGTENFEILMDRRREIRKMRTVPETCHLSIFEEGHPFAHDNPRWREFFYALVTGKELPSFIAMEEEETVISPPQNALKLRDFTISDPPDIYALKLRDKMIGAPPDEYVPEPQESEIAGPSEKCGTIACSCPSCEFL